MHCDRSVREKRLMHNREQPELITKNIEYFVQFLKRKTLELGGIVIDTRILSVNNVHESMK